MEKITTLKNLVLIVLLLSINFVSSQVLGDYRSVNTGNWNALASWEYFNGTTWTTPSGNSPQGYPGQFSGTQNVTIQSGHTITFLNTITTLNFSSLTINGILNLSGSGGAPVFNINSGNTIVTPNLTPAAAINFSSKGSLTFPANSTLQVGVGGITGACTNNQQIFIGTVEFAVCTGAGGTGITFADLMASGGTLNAIPASNSPVCQNQTINLTGSISGSAGTGLTYTWTITNPLGQISTVNSQNTTITNAISGTYIAKLTCNTTYSGLAFSNEETINVVVNALPNVITSIDVTCCPNKIQMLTVSGADSYVWSSNVSGILFEDALAQVPYSGSNLSVIYVKTSTTASITAQGTNSLTSCSTSDSTILTILNPAIWDGNQWLSVQNSQTPLVFQGNYTSTSNLEGCSCVVNSGNIVFNHNLIVEDNVVVNGGSLQFNNNAYVIQNSLNANSGNVTIKRNSTNMVRLDYTGWSSPVTGQNLFDFSPLTLTNRFYEYSSSSNAYQVVANVVTGGSGVTFASGKGYLLRAPNTWSSTTPSAYPGSFTGTLNNGNGYSPAVGIGFNMVGNPYPSPINADDFIANNSAIGVSTLYFWSHTLAATNGIYAQSNYASYNLLGGVASQAGGLQPDGIIQVGQGFILNATTTGNTNFNNGQRVSSSNGQFFRTSNAIERHRLWFGLTNENNSFNQILLGYMTGATNGVDQGIDGALFESSNSSIYTIINNQKYSIQGRSLPFASTDVVVLGFKAQTPGQYTISLNEKDGLFAGNQEVYLKDNLLNITHDIKTSAYTFASAAGEFASRFEIVYGAPLSVETPSFTEDSVVVYNNESGITINAGNTLIDSVKVFDVRGRLLVTKSKVDANSIAIENVSTEKQVLIVQITSTDNVTISKKVIN